MEEELWQEGRSQRSPDRGVGVGPWDVDERGWQALDLIDLGGLRIPRTAARKVQLKCSRSSEECAEAALIRDASAALQLQAFRTAGEPEWEQVCMRLAVDVRARGGEAEQGVGRAGVELRAVIPVVSGPHEPSSRTVRFIGCDGPGWLLRGVVSGEVALPESRDEWAYSCFESVVVDPSFVPRPAAVSASPAVYAPAAPPQRGRMILLRVPD
ncbi:DUF3710 domain-containing protein [Streptomyces sp. NPDC059752]|uniref:DUF3710 domain-containing protein n=1 Tax=unclassified Streptomyces TaxID=2593676 RepID=UPI00364F1FBC